MNIHYFLKSNTARLRTFKKLITICTAMCFLVLQANAQVPTNDEPCNGTTISAITLPVNAACAYTPGSNVDASNSNIAGSIASPSCANGGFNNAVDVWYRATIPAGATSLTVKTISATVGGNAGMADGGMSFYTASGTCPNLVMTEVGCNDDGPLNGSMPILTVNQPGGTVVYIRVWGVGGETGGFNICATANIPPANNECANAQTLTVNPNLLCGTVAAGTCASATLSTTTPAPACGTTNSWDDDVWYKFVATGATHTVSLLNVAGSSTAMVINLYSVPPGGDCTNLTFVNCTVGNLANIGSLTAGTTYYVRVFTNVVNTASNTTFNICIGTPPPPPPNDDCINATVLTVNADYNCGVTTAGTTVSATTSNTLPLPSCIASGGNNDDVWYSFVATTTAHRVSLVNALTGGIAADMATSVYSGTCSNLTELQCTDPEPNVINLTGLTIGQTYYVRVMTWSATATTTATFNICVGTAPPPPSNDNCISAIPLTVNANYACGVVTAGTTISATATTLAPTTSCSVGGANDDVWFSFVATGPSHRISLLNIVGSTTAMTTVVYSGTCGTGTLTEKICNTTNIFNVTGLTAGQTYYVRVFTTSTTAGLDANFNICIGTPPPPPPNDECTGAISLTVNANQLCGVTTPGTTAGATQSSTLPTPTCSGANGWDDDVWYSFVAVTNNHSISLTNVTGLTTNMLTSVYQGTCGSLTQIACTTVDPNFITLSTLTPGTTYYVRVQTELTGQDANFNVCIGTPGPGAVCSAGNPFCSTLGVTYPSVTNQPSLGGQGVYGCLFTTPNPTWFVMQVAVPGTLVFQVSQTSGDVDYAAWGPFTSQGDGCTQIGATPATITPISCSYSTAATETVTIPNALVGQWYVVLITNFLGNAGTITFNTAAGNVGSTNCNIVCNTTAANNGPTCVGGTFNLTSTAIAGSTFAWTGPGFTSNVQNPTNVTAPASPGSYVYNVTATLGAVACSGSTTVVVSAPPVAPTVVTPLTYCQGATAPALTATVTTPGNTLVYYTAPTGGTGVASLIPSTATIGTITYYVSQKAGNCEGPRAVIVVNVLATTTPAVTISGSPITYCQGVTAVSLAPNVTAAAGGTLNWYTAVTGGIPSATPIIPSTTASGSTNYYVSQTIGTCEGPRSPIQVIVTPASPAPTVTTPVTFCQGATTLPVLNATGTSILWWGTSLTGGSSSTTAPVLSSATAGTFTYYVTQNTNGCISSPRTPIVVNVTALPTAPTVLQSTITYCQGTTAAQLSATTLAGYTLTWYATATATTGIAVAPIPSTANAGTTVYYVGANNGTCQGPRTAITVNVNPTPAAPNVVTPVTYCQGATAVALTTTSGTNLLWYTASIGGTGTAILIPQTTIANTTPYYVSATTGSCEGPRATINVIVIPTPATPQVTSPISYCQNATSTPLTASGVGAITFLWYTQAAPGGTSSTTAPSPSTATAGNTNYYVSAIQGVCESPRALITITTKPTPAVPTVTTPVTYCQGATAVPISAVGIGVICYVSPTGGTGSTTLPTPSTSSNGVTTYYVTQTINGCESPRTPIVVTVNPLPLAPTAPSPLNLCQNVTTTALTATGTNLLWYTQAAPGGTGSTTAIVPSVSTVGTITYYVSQSALTCEGPRTPIVVNVKAPITVDAGANVTIARGATTQLLGVVTNATNPTYLWTANQPQLALTSATIINPIANPIQTTIYKLLVSDPTGPCPAVSANVTVNVVQSCINVRNAFTPNGDGKNDTWFVYDQNFCLASNGCYVNVFNRYGSKVYESRGYTNNWDGTYKGKTLPDGTYYAVIEFVLFDGSKQVIRKDVTILR
jgi:gliding motility-associated-like protein